MTKSYIRFSSETTVRSQNSPSWRRNMCSVLPVDGRLAWVYRPGNCLSLARNKLSPARRPPALQIILSYRRSVASILTTTKPHHNDLALVQPRPDKLPFHAKPDYTIPWAARIVCEASSRGYDFALSIVIKGVGSCVCAPQDKRDRGSAKVSPLRIAIYEAFVLTALELMP
jgi:hypothetical protein